MQRRVWARFIRSILTLSHRLEVFFFFSSALQGLFRLVAEPGVVGRGGGGEVMEQVDVP